MIKALVEISLGASVLIFLLLCFTPLLAKRYTTKWRYWVWLALCLRLVIPFNINLPDPPVSVSVAPNPISSPQLISGSTSTAFTNSSRLEHPEAIQTGNPATPAKNRIPSLSTILFWLWIIGSIVFLLWNLSGYAFFRKSIHRYGKPADKVLQECLSVQKCNLHINKEIRMLTHSKLKSPLMIGFFRPILLLPSGLDVSDLDMVLKHELTHYKRLDLWYKLILLFVQSLHWFNPFVHFMARAANRDIEISCDDEVLHGCSIEERKKYGETLLHVIQKGCFCRTMLSTNFYFGKKGLKMRIISLFDQSRKKSGTFLYCSAVTVIACAGIFFSITDTFTLNASSLQVNVYGYGYGTGPEVVYFTSCDSKLPEQDLLSLKTGYPSQEGTEVSVLKLNLYSPTIKQQAVLNGHFLSNQQNEAIVSTPLFGTKLEEKNVSINAFSGTLQISKVNAKDAFCYQYTYSLQNGKNQVQISFYASDLNPVNPFEMENALSSLQVAVPRDGLYDRYVFTTLKPNPRYTILNELSSDWGWNTLQQASEKGAAVYQSSVGLPVLNIDILSAFMGAGDTLIYDEHSKDFSKKYQIYAMKAADGQTFYRYYYQYLRTNATTYSLGDWVELSFASTHLLDSFSDALVNRLLYANVPIRLVFDEPDDVQILYGVTSSYAMSSTDAAILKELADSFRGLTFEPSAKIIDSFSMFSLTFYSNNRQIAKVDVDDKGVFRLNGGTECYVVSSGQFDYNRLEGIYNASRNTANHAN